MNTETRTVDGITFLITKKDIKTLRMKLLPDGTVTVSVPYSANQRMIDDFLKKGAEWAKKTLEKKGKEIPKEKVDNNTRIEFIYHLGEKIPVKYSNYPLDNIELADEGIVVNTLGYPGRDTVIRTIKEIERRRFANIIPDLAEECERITHIRPYEWRIRDMKTRWGTCNVTDKRIWLRLELCSYPPECIKAVMIHELCHFYEKQHNEHFYQLMEEFYPEYKEAEIILREQKYDWC